jgi:hypothetical protein
MATQDFKSWRGYNTNDGVCSCSGTRHQMLINCLICGKIICSAEKASIITDLNLENISASPFKCSFCSNPISFNDKNIDEDLAIYMRKWKKKMKRSNQDLPNADGKSVALERAINQTNRLVQMDQQFNQIKTDIIDESKDADRIVSMWNPKVEQIIEPERDNSLEIDLIIEKGKVYAKKSQS